MYENVPHVPRKDFRSHGAKRADGWIWIGGVAALLVIGVIFFGPAGGDSTDDVHPGGAGDVAEPYAGAIDDTGPGAPIAGVPDAAD